SDAPVRRYATVAAVGRRQGLHVGITRTVAFGTPPSQLLDAHHHASMLLGTAVYFSQSGWKIGDVWARIRRIYEKFGAADEWRLADQGEVCGYEPCEAAILPGSDVVLQAGQPVFWHPSIGPATAGDTVLIQPGGQVCLTHAPQWPQLAVSVKGTTIELPGVLVRDGHEDWAVG
ncbi:MAG: M24 family metallopeptidase, partial [Planctomycetaceae bacterium]|nr:M24 family metallopeptidase [Planctomycetaceae bacterium]